MISNVTPEHDRYGRVVVQEHKFVSCEEDPLLKIIARGLAAAIAALVSSLAYPPQSYSSLIFAGLAILLLSIHGTRPAIGGFLGGVFGVTLSAISLVWIGPESLWHWIVVSFVTAGLFSLFGGLASYLMKIPGWPLWVASTYALFDYLQGVIDISAITTLRPVYTQSSTVIFNLSNLGGSPLVAFAVALVSGSIAALIIHLWFRNRNILWIFTLSAFAMLVVIAAALIPETPAIENRDEFKVLAVQPNQGSGIKVGELLGSVPGELGPSIQWLRSYYSQYPYYGTEPPDVAVLPSRITTEATLNDEGIQKVLSATAKQLGAPILMGYSTGDSPELGLSRYVIWDSNGRVEDFELQPHGQGPIEVSYTPVPDGDVQTLIQIIRINGKQIGVIESAQVFESLDEMENLSQVQYIIIMRPNISGRVGAVVGNSAIVSARLLGASVDRPTLSLSKQGPTAFSNNMGAITSWATNGRPGYIYSAEAVNDYGGLPSRRDSLLFLLFLILPIAAVITSLYIHKHNISAKRYLKDLP